MARKTRQQKIIQNYYENRDSIALQNLSEIVSELYLVSQPGKRAQLWRRAEIAMQNLKVAPTEILRIIKGQDLKALAAIISGKF